MNKEKLEITAQGDREIVMTRTFSAPKHLVFDAWTKPELLKQWFGPWDWKLTVCDVDLTVGGAYRFVMQNPKGQEMGWGGVYKEIVRPDRFVNTEVFDEAWYPGEALLTNVLTEENGKTTFTSTILYVSAEARDGVLNSGMSSGVEASYDKLEAFLVAQAEATSGA